MKYTVQISEDQVTHSVDIGLFLVDSKEEAKRICDSFECLMNRENANPFVNIEYFPEYKD